MKVAVTMMSIQEEAPAIALKSPLKPDIPDGWISRGNSESRHRVHHLCQDTMTQVGGSNDDLSESLEDGINARQKLIPPRQF